MTTFIAPPNQHEFNQWVWEIARQVPAGKVTTYGKIAECIGAPEGVAPPVFKANGARWVGSAMAACPDDVPWQRVINAQGKISIRSGGGHLRQRALLEGEGIIFDEKDKINLKRFGWMEPVEPEQKTLW